MSFFKLKACQESFVLIKKMTCIQRIQLSKVLNLLKNRISDVYVFPLAERKKKKKKEPLKVWN